MKTWGHPIGWAVLCGAVLFAATFRAQADNALASTAYASDSSTFEETRDFINQLPKMSPGIIRIGQYTPEGMPDDRFGVWLEYETSRTYYVRLRDFTRMELGTTFSGDCRIVLSGDKPSIGHRYSADEGWQRDRGQVFIRSSDCETTKSTARAYRTLIEIDGTTPDVTSKLPGFE
ncbi:MAG: hypothetical protein AAFP81_19015 [Pseudomonadota bacterium]